MDAFRGRTRVKSRVTEQTWVRVFRDDSATEQKGRCRYCTEPMTSETISGDHLIPRSQGGTTSRKNVKAACKACNRAKGSLPEKAFLVLIKTPEPGAPLHILRAYMRRRIWVRAHRACERIERFAR